MGFRLHVKKLPGTPDIAFASRRKAIFVNGCFWHAHKCQNGRMPTTRPDFWKQKIEGNKARDRKKRRELRKLGWASLVICECEVKRLEMLERKITAFLDNA